MVRTSIHTGNEDCFDNNRSTISLGTPFHESEHKNIRRYACVSPLTATESPSIDLPRKRGPFSHGEVFRHDLLLEVHVVMDFPSFSMWQPAYDMRVLWVR